MVQGTKDVQSGLPRHAESTLKPHHPVSRKALKASTLFILFLRQK
jgi:hypothetical protein